jgi:hypothetical protein
MIEKLERLVDEVGALQSKLVILIGPPNAPSGTAAMPQRKSGCTGAILPSGHHELKAWQTGGVHVRSLAAKSVIGSIG